MSKQLIKAAEAATGIMYTLDLKTGKAKKVFNSLAELKKLRIDEAIDKVSMDIYIKYLRGQLPGEPLKVKGASFTIKGFRFSFTSDGIAVKDLNNFSKPVDWLQNPTPKQMKDLLMPTTKTKTYTAAENREHVENGKKAVEDKKLLKEQEVINTKKLAAVTSTDELIKAKEKALRLISRIEKKQTDSKRLIEEVPEMVNFRRLKINMTLACKNYRLGKLRWAKFVERMKWLLTEETFEIKPEPAPKFMGLDPAKWNHVELKDDKYIVDGTEKDAQVFICKYLLQGDKYPLLMPQLMKFFKGEIKEQELFDKPFAKDKMVHYNEKLLHTKGHLQTVIDLAFLFNEILPHTRLFKENAPELKLKDKVRVYYMDNFADGTVVSLDKGVEVFFPADGESYFITNFQKYRKLC